MLEAGKGGFCDSSCLRDHSGTRQVAKCLACFPPERPAEPESCLKFVHPRLEIPRTQLCNCRTGEEGRKEDGLHDWQKLSSAPLSATLDWSPEGLRLSILQLLLQGFGVHCADHS